MITIYNQSMEAEVVALWNKCLTEDAISTQIFRKQVLFDENFQRELCFVAIEDNTIVGYLLATKRVFPYNERGLEPTRGWINLMFVDKNYRRKGIGSTLVKKAEEELKARGAERITLGAYSPNYFFPGIDVNAYKDAVPFFESLGYEYTAPAESMNGSLMNYQFPADFEEKLAKANAQGYTFKKFSYEYSFKLLDFLKEEFGAGWKRNALMKMQANVAEDYIWMCVDANDDVVGFCMRAIDDSECRFGPFGVKKELRSHGLGNILFNLMCMDMKAMRHYNLYFLWTHDAMAFYQRHGIDVYRTYKCYDKHI